MSTGRGQRGLTLVELMVSMLLASTITIVALTVQTSFSSAYRYQTTITELQQTLRAARETIARDVRAAGYGITRFRVATGAFGSNTGTDLLPLSVVNNASGKTADHIRLYRADPSALAVVTAADTATYESITVSSAEAFEAGDLVVIAANTVYELADGTRVADWDACVVRITEIDGDTVTFDESGAPFNAAANPHCKPRLDAVGSGETTLSLLVARSYRIDPDRRELGVLQMHPTGELDDSDWVDLGIGFTDLQIATRYYEEADVVDADGDGDPTRDWYSSDNMTEPDPDGERPAGPPAPVITQVGLSLAARTTVEVSGVASTETPAFIDDSSADAVDHNRLGDAPAIDLTKPDGALPEEHRGRHVYRWTSTTIDTRNLGAGR